MTRLGDLARSLGGIELSTRTDSIASLHTLILGYPVLELLPVSVSNPHLEPPALLKEREAPPRDPEEAGIHDTTFFARLPVQPRNPFALTPVQNSHMGLLAAIEAACTMPGPTTVEMVSYSDPVTGEVSHRFRLQTKQQAAIIPTFELTDKGWHELLRHDIRIDWIRLLKSMVARRSARAYYHVRQRLVAAYGETVANSEEASWADMGNAQPPRSIKDLLVARLCPENRNTTLDDVGGGNGSMLITPPCGHQSMMRKISLLALTVEGCVNFGCPTCGARVLRPKDNDELMLETVCLKAHTFVQNYSAWTDLDEGMRDDMTEEEQQQRFELPALAVMYSLSGALTSLRLPALISPPELSYIGQQESQLVLAEFEETFGDGEWPVTGTVMEIWDGLEGVVRTALGEKLDASATPEDALPPGWMQNTQRWLNRAIRLVTDRGCRIASPEHRGLHLHDGDFYCGVLKADEYGDETMEADDLEDGDHKVTPMDELTKMLNGSSMNE